VQGDAGEGTAPDFIIVDGAEGGTGAAPRPHMQCRRTDPVAAQTYADLYEWLAPGQLLAEPPRSWAVDWAQADPDRFTV
jgi:hypothetical protein